MKCFMGLNGLNTEYKNNSVNNLKQEIMFTYFTKPIRFNVDNVR